MGASVKEKERRRSRQFGVASRLEEEKNRAVREQAGLKQSDS